MSTRSPVERAEAEARRWLAAKRELRSVRAELKDSTISLARRKYLRRRQTDLQNEVRSRTETVYEKLTLHFERQQERISA